MGDKLCCMIDALRCSKQVRSSTLAVRRSMPGRAVMSRATPRLALQAARAAAAPLVGSCWGRPASFLLEGGNAATAPSLGVDEPCAATTYEQHHFRRR